MKVLSIGDIHGHDSWKRVIPRMDNYNKVVFIGDYVDSFHSSNDKIRENLLEIIQLKKDNPDKVVLLWGNHDVQYLFPTQYRCSGFRPDAQPDLTIIFNENKNLFQAAFGYKNYLWTHAGISNKWFNEHYHPEGALSKWRGFGYLEGIDAYVAGMLNGCFGSHDRDILCEVSYARGGASQYGGIFWADIKETRNDYLDNFEQICGHTPVDRNTTIRSGDSSITYIDSLGSEAGDFYELEIE